jgi:uncharacterized lipoprotein YddW (UPF0748 family)
MMSKILFTILLAGFFVQAQAQQNKKKEFRGVWISTVANIDWPQKPTKDTAEQKKSFIKLLNLLRSVGLNAVVVQIRPAADAFYKSDLEPWSEWLTGTQGQAPEPFYDPLEFMIAEAKKRNMEFHAWLNPYRAVFNTKKTVLAPNHIMRKKPEWFLTYGDKKYFDPGNKDAQKFVTEVVKDIVSRYKIDAIHMDDYFYPYRIDGKEFPDDSSYKKHGNGMDKDTWRRSNTDSIILSLSKAIKQTNKKVRFGISPFGVWRNASKDSLRGSNTGAMQTNYDDLYADILLWLKNDWIDYVAPQLYWEIGHELCDYNTLVDWWAKNTYGKDCYIGMGIYRAKQKGWKDSTQLPRQIDKLRTYPTINGMIFFSAKTFEKNPFYWNDTLRQKYFRLPY